MKIVVIEDERPAAQRMMQLIREILPSAEIFGHFDSISESLKWLSSHAAPDLIITDIELADGQSFEIFEKVKVGSPIIFTTAYDQFAIRAFKHNSIDYLLKPIDPRELEQAIQKYHHLNRAQTDFSVISKLKEMMQQQATHFKERFMVKVGDKIHSVPTVDIAFFYSAQKATFIQTIAHKKYLIDFTMDQLDNQLNPRQFFRLNRKYITSIDAIDEIITYSNSRLRVTLKQCSDQDILISREKVAAFKEWLDR